MIIFKICPGFKFVDPVMEVADMQAVLDATLLVGFECSLEQWPSVRRGGLHDCSRENQSDTNPGKSGPQTILPVIQGVQFSWAVREDLGFKDNRLSRFVLSQLFQEPVFELAALKDSTNFKRHLLYMPIIVAFTVSCLKLE
jgi:hypothetical protein